VAFDHGSSGDGGRLPLPRIACTGVAPTWLGGAIQTARASMLKPRLATSVPATSMR
jgi:hypothetical protein